MKRITFRKTETEDIPTPLPEMVGIFVDEDGNLCRIDESGNTSILEGMVSMSSSTPLARGAATPGVASSASRGDHVHPAVDLSALSQTANTLPLSRGGLGVALADPNADRIAFWDDSAGQFQWLDLGTGLSITGTTLSTVNLQAHSAMLDDIGALIDPNADRLMFWDDSAGHIVWLSLGAGLSITGTTITASGGGGGGGLVDGDYGDITVSGTGTTMSIDPATVSLAKMANLAANSFIGNNSGSSATPVALSVAAAKTLLAITASDVSGLGSLATASTVNGGQWSGTDLSLADGGTGASLTDPNDDRIMFWDDSAGQMTWLSVGTGLAISGTTLSVAGGGTPWTQIGSTLNPSAAATATFTSIPNTYSELLMVFTLAISSTATMQVAFSANGSSFTPALDISPSISTLSAAGGLWVPRYTANYGLAIGATTSAGGTPGATSGTAGNIGWTLGAAMTTVRLLVSTGTMSGFVSLWGR